LRRLRYHPAFKCHRETWPLSSDMEKVNYNNWNLVTEEDNLDLLNVRYPYKHKKCAFLSLFSMEKWNLKMMWFTLKN